MFRPTRIFNSVLPVVTAARKVTWTNWNQAARNNCLTETVFFPNAEMWCGLVKRLGLASFWRLSSFASIVSNVAHVSTTHISRTCLASEWCEKGGPIATLDAQSLENVQGGGFARGGGGGGGGGGRVKSWSLKPSTSGLVAKSQWTLFS